MNKRGAYEQISLQTCNNKRVEGKKNEMLKINGGEKWISTKDLVEFIGISIDSFYTTKYMGCWKPFDITCKSIGNKNYYLINNNLAKIYYQYNRFKYLYDDAVEEHDKKFGWR